MTIKESVRLFCSSLKCKSTFETYRRYLENLPSQDKEIGEITKTDVLAWDLKNNVERSCVKSLFRYLNENDHIPTNPGSTIHLERIPMKEAKYLDREQVARLREIITNERDRSLIECYLQTGLRLNELRGLKIGVVRGKDKIQIIGKGNKIRTIFLSKQLQELIWNHCVGKNDNEALFPLSMSGIRRVIKQNLGKIGLNKGYSVHSLRHSMLSECYRMTKDLRLVQEIAGHSSPTVTARYTHISQDEKVLTINNLFGG